MGSVGFSANTTGHVDNATLSMLADSPCAFSAANQWTLLVGADLQTAPPYGRLLDNTDPESDSTQKIKGFEEQTTEKEEIKVLL